MISKRLIKLTTLTLTERILESKYLDERSMTNQTIYRLIKLTTLTLMTTLTPMTRFFDLNYYKDFLIVVRLKILTITERILESKYLDERTMTNQTIYRPIKLTTLTLMTRFSDLNYYKAFLMTDQTQSSYLN